MLASSHFFVLAKKRYHLKKKPHDTERIADILLKWPKAVIWADILLGCIPFILPRLMRHAWKDTTGAFS